MAYSDAVLDHYNNPRNVGKMNIGDKNVGTGMVGAPSCGDVMKLQIKVKDDIIEDAKFKAYGETIEEAFSNSALALINIFTTDSIARNSYARLLSTARTGNPSFQTR